MIIQSYSSRFETPRVKLSREAYENSGIEIFSTEEIPFTDRTSPKFAQNLTNLFVSRVKKLQSQGKTFPKGIHIYELGAGTGILSKRILDLLKTRHKEIYHKVILHVSDISKPSIIQLKSLPVFKEHIDHVLFEVIDATKPKFTHKPLLVYFTYLIDSFPTRQILIKDGQISDLQFQTSLKSDSQIIDVSKYPPKVLTEKEITKVLFSSDVKYRLILAPQILPILEEETKFVPVEEVLNLDKKELEDLNKLKDFLKKDQPFAFCYSYPARETIRLIIQELETGGFLFFSDFGITTAGYEMVLPLEYGLVIAFPADFIGFKQIAQELGKTSYLTSNPPPESQEMMIDSLPDNKDIKNLFEKFSVNNSPEQISIFLDKIRTILSNPGNNQTIKQITDLYESQTQDAKRDNVLLTNLAYFLLQSSFYPEASFYADLLLKNCGHSAGLYYYLIKGKSAQKLGNPKAAEEFFKKAINGKMGFQAYSYLADLYWAQNRYQECIGALKEYLKFTRQGDYQNIMSSITQAEKKIKEIL